MDCVVTGGAGFIGSHLVERLIRSGHHVRVLDDLSTSRKENLESVLRHIRLELVEIDVTDFDAVKGYFQGVDWVFHLAALADIVPSIQRPMDYHHCNVEGTVAVLEAARQAGVRRVIYAASSSCYGIPDDYPTSEEATARPQYPYALTKYVAEEYVLHWGQVYHLPVVLTQIT